MKDNFEKFIEDNRSEFDVFEPREKLWTSIDARLSKNKWRRQRWYYGMAASLLLLVGIVSWLQWRSQEVVSADKDVIITRPEIQKAEQYYSTMIGEKRSQLSRYCSQQPVLCDEFDKELDTLAIMYSQLKKEYVATGDKEIVLEAMISNLQLQVQVLSEQLQAIQHIDARKKII